MTTRLFLAAFATAALLSAPAFAAGGKNTSVTAQFGLGNVAVVGQAAGHNSQNYSAIGQAGAFNGAGVTQLAVHGGSNAAMTLQAGVGNVSVTNQLAW
jgi:hypothetical protein